MLRARDFGPYDLFAEHSDLRNNGASPRPYRVQPHHELTTTLVVPPRVRLISMLGPFFSQPPAVKSGTSIELERFSTDH